MRLDELISDPQNRRKHSSRNRRMLRQALQEVGAARSIVIDEAGVVLAGNATIQAAADAGITNVQVVDTDGQTLVAVRRSGLSEDEKRRLALFDNRVSELSEWDTERLLQDLQDGLDFKGLFTTPELQKLTRQARGAMERTADDTEMAPPAELQKKWKTKRGQTWQLGRHRLACGSATDRATLAAVIEPGEADLLLTDPPYGVDYTGKTKDALTINNDGREALYGLLHASFTMAAGAMAEGAAFYICAPAGPQNYEFASAINRSGLTWRQTLAWIKDAMVLGHSDYHYKHEAIFYGSKGRRADWHGDRRQTSAIALTEQPGIVEIGEGVYQVQAGPAVYVIRGADLQIEQVWPDAVQVDRPKASIFHPTMKPEKLWEIFIDNSSEAGQVVLDPFSGSGTTIRTCERMERSARAVELNPGYTAVALEAWHLMTGAQPVLKD